MKKILYFMAIGAFLLTGSSVIAQTPGTGNILYVKPAATGDGSSWTNAIDLTTALQWAQANKGANLWSNTNPLKIYVAGGTYKPNISPRDNSLVYNSIKRDAAFLMVKDVQLYGGFTGTESTPEQRNLANTAYATILSGDLNGDDDGTLNTRNDNVYHVVLSIGEVGNTLLDGFTIIGGTSYGTSSIEVNEMTINRNSGGGIYSVSSSLTLNHIIISGNMANNNGGGMYNLSSSSPILNNVSINGNKAGYGGGMYNYKASPILNNVVISGNEAASSGGGMYNFDNALPILINITISRNTANLYGGGMYNFNNASPKLYNSIVWGNTSTNYNSFNNVYNNNSTPEYTNSLIEGSGGGWSSFGVNKGNNIDVNPVFTNAANGDYTLKNTSPAINAGSNSLYPGLDANTKDLAGNTRVYKYSNSGTIDLGAYEYQGDPITLPVALVSFTAKTNGNYVKLEWVTASETNNKGFEIWRSGNDGGEGLGFVKIGDAPATTTYSFTDKKPANGNNYYKLVQMDNDGKVTELGIRTVTFNFPLFTFLLYPNPTNDVLTASFAAGVYHQLEIMDLNGKVLQRKVINIAESSKEVSLGVYPAGTYLIKLTGKSKITVEKVIKR